MKFEIREIGVEGYEVDVVKIHVPNNEKLIKLIGFVTAHFGFMKKEE